MIRILHIVGSASVSGTTKQLALLAHALPKSEFDLHVCSLDAGGLPKQSLKCDGIEPVVFNRHAAIDPLAFLRLRQHIGKLRPDVVHTWQHEAGTLGRMAARSVGIKRLVASHRHSYGGLNDFRWRLERWLSSRTDRIVTNAVAIRDFCIKRGLPRNKLVYIPNAVSPAHPARLTRPEFLAQFRIPADAKLVLYLGPLEKEKRLKELIWATDQLKAVAVPAHFLLVGEGEQRSRLERYRWQNRIDDRVHFVGGRSDVSEFLAHADVLWQAGTHEGQSSAVLEAMAAGLPVVAADAGGNRELVVSGETGYLVPIGERAGFARWTLPLLEDAELARQMGAAGKRRIAQCHQIGEIAGKYAEMYRELVT